MANFNLTGQKIKNTYGQVAQVNDSNKLVDGLGNEKQIVTSSIVNFPTEVSRSAAEAGFGAGGGATWPVSGTPSGIVSGAAQLPIIGINTADIASLTAATSSYLTSLPSGVVSSSAQVDLSQATGTAGTASKANTVLHGQDTGTTARQVLFTSTISGYDSVRQDPKFTYTPNTHTLEVTASQAQNATSASHAITASYADTQWDNILNKPSGLVSGSSQIDLSEASGTVTSASYAVTASHATNVTLQNGVNVGTIQSANIDRVVDASAGAVYSVAIGDNADAGEGIAIGGGASSGTGIAIGSGSINTGVNSIAMGNAALVSGDSSLNIVVGNASSLSTGVQTINIGSGINNTGGYSTAIGHTLTNNGTGGNVLIGRSVTTTGDYSIGIGENAQAQSQGGIAIGQGAISSGNSVAIGQGAYMGNSYGFAGGNNARASNDASIAIGGDVQVSSNQGIAIGTDSDVFGSSVGAIALGQGAQVTGTQAIGIGQGVSTSNANQINIGDVYHYNSGSAGTKAKIDAVLNLSAQDPLPTGALGDLSVSGSSLYFHNGTSWSVIS